MSTEVVEKEERDYDNLPVYMACDTPILCTDPTSIKKAQEAARFLDRVGLPEDLLEKMALKRMSLAGKL